MVDEADDGPATGDAGDAEAIGTGVPADPVPLLDGRAVELA